MTHTSVLRWAYRFARGHTPILLAGLIGVVSSAGADEVRLSTGEVLTVTNVRVTETSVEFSHPVLGTMILPREKVEVIRVAPVAPPVPPTAEVPAGDPPAAESPPAEQSDSAEEAAARAEARQKAIEKADADFDKQNEAKRTKLRLNGASFFTGWKGSVEFGLNGSQGNSENISLRAGARAARIAELMETRANISYSYAADDGVDSKNRGEANILNDWLFKDSRWGMFAKGTAEYDQFQDWDWRLSAFAGPSYAFVKSKTMTLRGRLGGGVTKEIGGVNEWIPEGLVGLDLQYQITERQSVFFTGEYLPSLTEFPEFRTVAKVGYKLMIDPDSNMSLNLGVEDRYDSNPGEGFDNNNIDYFMLLGLDF